MQNYAAEVFRINAITDVKNNGHNFEKEIICETSSSEVMMARSCCAVKVFQLLNNELLNGKLNRYGRLES